MRCKSFALSQSKFTINTGLSSHPIGLLFGALLGSCRLLSWFSMADSSVDVVSSGTQVSFSGGGSVLVVGVSVADEVVLAMMGFITSRPLPYRKKFEYTDSLLC